MRTPTIGLEIHAELLTVSKLLCGCRNSPNEGEPNTHICPVCVGYPGALPFLNRKAVEHVIRVGTALGGDIATTTAFDRKHYFYPDIPKGYQVSQYPYPPVRNATLAGVGIQRIHLEEDTAKSSHDVTAAGSVIDFNRSGVPLMELVTEPVLHTAEDAKHFADMLQMTLRYLGVARARMELGEMRIEANISLSDTDTLGTKVEVKNLNSFKSVISAIEYEIARQTEVLDGGGTVTQETRGWNENTGKTFSQRIKENSEEYRYMPEPDLPEYRIDEIPEWSRESIMAGIPELPERKHERYTEELRIPERQAWTLVRHAALAGMLDHTAETVRHGDAARLAANYLTTDVMRHMETRDEDVFIRITKEAIAELVEMLTEGAVSSRGAKDIVAVIAEEGGMPRDIAEKRGLFQQSDAGMLGEVIDRVIRSHPNIADEYRAGKTQVLQFFVGQVMKETEGSANPGKVREMLAEALGPPAGGV